MVPDNGIFVHILSPTQYDSRSTKDEINTRNSYSNIYATLFASVLASVVMSFHYILMALSVQAIEVDVNAVLVIYSTIT